jgi:organic hydroperoxide reductase OsmC/OhrA
MHPYPHVYVASAAGSPAGGVVASSPRLPDLQTAPPPEFDGPGGVWSPETLFIAALADCFVLTFRGVTRAAKFEWLTVECSVEGVLEKAEGVTQFTRYVTKAKLTVAPGADLAKAKQLLERAEHLCLIANSLKGARTIETEVVEAAA